LGFNIQVFLAIIATDNCTDSTFTQKPCSVCWENRFDSFWLMDHFHQISVVGKPEEPMLEGWTTLSFLAAVTTKIKLDTLVTGVIYRHPSVLAKIDATMDVLSGGRLLMGIGAAWNEEESGAYGITFPSTGLRFLSSKMPYILYA
jgi:alkanesulfonate monooxygenase SsuD/methylene tetrahydromethanopterin reductase-like flavin-dependent oxidoreductase (luciferase family)